MTNQHPITPPPELVQQWRKGGPTYALANNAYEHHIATQAAQWGADQQLEATDTWIRTEMKDRQRPVNRIADDHRADMRPKPPSLKEQALGALGRFNTNTHTRADEMTQDFDLIRRALETL